MRAGVRERPAVVAAREELHRFRGERREGREPAEESGDEEEPPDGRQVRAIGEERHGNSDKETADEVRGERPQRQLDARSEPEVQSPTQPGAEGGADSDGGERGEERGRHGPRIIITPPWPNANRCPMTWSWSAAVPQASRPRSVSASLPPGAA